MPDQNIHNQQNADRTRYTDLIIQSTARNKVIIAGPGTGKSFTFRKLLETKTGDNLALTFINNLAFDLQKDLGKLAESHTFHGYCKKLLHKTPVDGIDTGFCYFPKLPLLIKSDADLIGIDLDKFDEAFHTLTEDDRIGFYIERGNYYNAVSHSDAVYRVLKYFQSGAATLPSFCQVVVDEYQDFNSLEVAFIDELAKTSPVLIAGDDDQAIYNFKNASPYHIRAKSSHPDFTKFDLPYCSRCTQVIIDAVGDITNKAKTLNKLQGRIDKKYFCFLPDKETDSAKYPKIIHANCSTHTRKAPYISKFIEKEISTIPQKEIDQAREKEFPCVLIAGPSYYTKQIYDYLKIGFTNIDYPDERNKEIEIIEGYRILMRDSESNLGWRIILECSDNKQKAKILKDTHASKNKFADSLDESFKNEHLSVVEILKKIRTGEQVAEDDKNLISEKCGHSVDELKTILGVEDNENTDEESQEASEDTSVSIKITTINGSKGLSANYVFLVGMNNTCSVLVRGKRKMLAGFPFDRNNPTDNEICQFIVGITRTRKKCYLISNSRFGEICNIQKSIFLDWINSARIDNIIVNADYFRNSQPTNRPI
jgi:superfamily I DNA/RNA helicase